MKYGKMRPIKNNSRKGISPEGRPPRQKKELKNIQIGIGRRVRLNILSLL